MSTLQSGTRNVHCAVYKLRGDQGPGELPPVRHPYKCFLAFLLTYVLSLFMFAAVALPNPALPPRTAPAAVISLVRRIKMARMRAAAIVSIT